MATGVSKTYRLLFGCCLEQGVTSAFGRSYSKITTLRTTRQLFGLKMEQSVGWPRYNPSVVKEHSVERTRYNTSGGRPFSAGVTSQTLGRESMYLDASNIGDVISRYDTLLLDCDGVLWANDHFTKFTGIPEAIEKLRSKGKQLYFVTNNSLHAREAYLLKFKDFAGFEADKDHVFGVAFAAALYLKNIAKIKGKCYLVGSKGMARELEDVGIPYLGLGPDLKQPSIHPDDLMSFDLDPEVEAVLVGFDEHFNYNKLFKAASYLSDPKCHYIATNDLEKALQLSGRYRQPLTGALIPAISAAASRQPLVLGKPLGHLLQCIQSMVPNMDLSRTLMIGDSLKTDIGFAKTIGVDSLLVMTGSSTEAHLRKFEQLQKALPTYFMESFSKFGLYL